MWMQGFHGCFNRYHLKHASLSCTMAHSPRKGRATNQIWGWVCHPCRVQGGYVRLEPSAPKHPHCTGLWHQVQGCGKAQVAAAWWQHCDPLVLLLPSPGWLVCKINKKHMRCKKELQRSYASTNIRHCQSVFLFSPQTSCLAVPSSGMPKLEFSHSFHLSLGKNAEVTCLGS